MWRLPPPTSDGGDPPVFTPEGEVDFGYDYGTNFGIPEAPGFQAGDTATTGLRVGVNQNLFTANEDAAGAWTDNVYSGNFRVEFDAYYYYPGGAGSTENMVVGINHTDTSKPLNYDQDNDGLGVGVPSPSPSGLDGYFLDFAGDIDLAGVDIFFMYGVPDTLPSTAGTSPVDGTPNGFDRNPAQILTDGGGFAWADALLPNENARNVEPAGLDPFFGDRFPFSGLGYPGHITNVWTRWRIEYIGGVVTIYSNQQDTFDVDANPATTETGWLPLLSYDDPLDRHTSGKVYLGMEDFFSGSNPLNYMIYDNLVVTPLIANGDANGDGTIDVADVTSIYNFLAGITGAPAGDGDVVAPAGVDAADAAAIQNFIVNGTPF